MGGVNFTDQIVVKQCNRVFGMEVTCYVDPVLGLQQGRGLPWLSRASPPTSQSQPWVTPESGAQITLDFRDLVCFCFDKGESVELRIKWRMIKWDVHEAVESSGSTDAWEKSPFLKQRPHPAKLWKGERQPRFSLNSVHFSDMGLVAFCRSVSVKLLGL